MCFHINISVDFSGGSHHASIPENISERDVTDVSLITGKLRRMGQADLDTEPGTAVVLKNDNMVVATQAESASEYISTVDSRYLDFGYLE